MRLKDSIEQSISTMEAARTAVRDIDDVDVRFAMDRRIGEILTKMVDIRHAAEILERAEAVDDLAGITA